MRQTALSFAGALLIFLLATLPESFVMKTLFIISTMILYVFITWFNLLGADEKEVISTKLKILNHPQKS
jgi:hypothetical protein